MEIKVGTKFNKVGTEEVVTVVKYDEQKGTVIVKFSNGRSIPMSTGSLMKEAKWKYVGIDEIAETVKEEKPKKEKVKKEKKKPIVKKSVTKIRNEITGLLTDYISNEWDELDYCGDKEVLTWVMITNKEVSETEIRVIEQFKVEYHIKEKQFEIYFNDEIADLIKDTEFGKLDIINNEFIEDKLKELLDLIVGKLNDKNENTKEKESEEN